MDRGRRHIVARDVRSAREIGFTLIELLVVMSILALTASVVILNAPPSKPPARVAAEAFAMRVQAALADAVIENAPYLLEIARSEYLISRFKDGEWEALSHMAVGSAKDDIAFHVETNSAASDNTIALNGVAKSARSGEGEAVLATLDPYGGDASILAHFESRRGNWIVSVAPDGAVKVERQ